ncbi:MAG: hypothetical protein ACREDR_08780, partial [Blastocatellia bacterium]
PRVLSLFLVFLAIVPFARLVYILGTTGANNQSSDDIYLLHQFVAKVLQGGFHWRTLFNDTFHNTHSNLVPGLIYLVFARLCHLNVYALLYLGVVLAAIKLVLLYDAFTREFRQKERLAALMMWPMMSALVFSVAQMSIFELDLQTVKTGVTEAGLALAIWAIVRFPRRAIAVWLATVAALAASFSFACGLIIWPLALGAMLVVGFRKIVHYAIVSFGALLSAGPYLYFIFISREGAPEATFQGLLRVRFVFQYIGSPFYSYSDNASREASFLRVLGGVGLAAFGLAVLLLYKRFGLNAIRSAVAPLALSLFALATAWQISLFRELIAPWYATFEVDFWIGLVGLAFVMWSVRGRQSQQPAASRLRFAAPAWSLTIGVLISACYLHANRSHSDKSFFLPTRAPVSAACLRNYGTAPTYCDDVLVKWLPTDYMYTSELGSDLAKNLLSVFAPDQQWTLQGDTILENVRYLETVGVPRIEWSPGLGSEFTSPTDFRHLNLFVPTPDSVDWIVTLPKRLKSAEFRSGVAICKDAVMDSTADGVTFNVFVTAGGTQNRVFHQHLEADDRRWRPFNLNLAEYAGQTITIRLTSEMGKNLVGDWAMYRYPRIDISMADDDRAEGLPKGIVPSNTDLSPGFRAPGPGDLLVDRTGNQSWRAVEMHPVGGADQAPSWLIDGSSPALEYDAPMNEELSNYSDFYFRARLTALSENIIGAVQVYYVLDDGPLSAYRSFIVPMLYDGKVHAYTFPIRLLGVRDSSCLVGLRIVPLSGSHLKGRATFSLFDFRLLRKTDMRQDDAKTQQSSLVKSPGIVRFRSDSARGLLTNEDDHRQSPA